ncbi:MAG TPA: hypothetical protein DF613_07655 [Lachnospiraceae bacterium]|nr:hypothetical protein [Lachnospiraceae bacterium]
MAGIKDVGGAKSVPGASVPKDGEAARQKVADAAGQTAQKASDVVSQAGQAARVAGQVSHMEAGQVMINQAARQAAEERQRLAEEQQERQAEREEREARDTPELSRQSRWFGLEGKLLEQASRRWILEMEEEAWEAILAWQPGQDGDIRRALAELSRLYLALLEALLTYTTGDEQTLQQERLDAVLAQKLSLIWNMDVQELDKFFNQTGQAAVLRAIKASLYKQATGASISIRAAEQLFDRGHTSGSGSRSSAGGSAAPGGGFYTLAKGGNVRVASSLSGHGDSGEKQIRQRLEVLNSFQSGGKSAGAAYAGGRRTAGIYRGNELATANAFARHMNGSGNLLKNPAFSARNDEAAGFLAAATAIKGQVYVESMARDSALRTPVRNAVDKLVDYYLSRKGVYKVYSYTVDAYERSKSPQKAMEEGLAYAYRIFAEKRGDGAYAGQDAYGERAGFFQALLKGLTLEEELKRGVQLLDLNWADFLRAIGQEDNKKLVLRLQNYSPWGTLLKTPKKEKRTKEDAPREKKGHRLMITEAFAVAVAVIAWLCYMLFFR